MEIKVVFSNINWIIVILLTMLSLGLGMFWHSGKMFGEAWKKEANPEMFKNKVNVPLVFGGTVVMHFIAISGLSMVVSGTGALNGLLVSICIWFFWILTTFYSTYIFAGRSIKLVLIDAGMYFVLFTVSGIVLGTF